MKFKFIPFIIVLAISALCGYGFYAANSGEPYCLYQLIISAVSVLIILGSGFALSYSERNINYKIVSAIFFIFTLIANVIFTFIPAMSLAAYIVVNGILVIIDISIIYAMKKSQ